MSFSRTVSRFESIRICSSTLCDRFCASSISRTAFFPAAKFRMRKALRPSRYRFFVPRPTILIPNSWLIVFKSSISERAGLKISALAVDPSRPARRARQRVVFPVPIPPVTTMNPFFSPIP